MWCSLIGVVFLSMQDLFGSPEQRIFLPHHPRYDNRRRKETAWKEDAGTDRNALYEFPQITEAIRYQKIGFQGNNYLCPFLVIHKNRTLLANPASPIRGSLSSCDRIPNIFLCLVPVYKPVFSIFYSLFSFL